MLSCDRAIRLLEMVKHMGQEFRADAFARVANRNLRVRVRPIKTDLYTPALSGELDGVREQIPDDLLQAGCISLKSARAPRPASRKRQRHERISARQQ